MTYTWQSVTKHIQAQNLGLKFNRRLDKIKVAVQHFPQDSVHLNICLEKHPRKDLFTAALTLHVPSNVLHTKKNAEKLMVAFDKAADALIREVEALKSDMGGAYRWEQKGRRALLHEGKVLQFAQTGQGDTQEAVEGEAETKPQASFSSEQFHRKIEPPESEPLADYLPIPRPDMQAHVLETVQREAENWDEEERKVFDLYFMEAFEPEEIEKFTKLDKARVEHIVSGLEKRVREVSQRVAEAEMETP